MAIAYEPDVLERFFGCTVEPLDPPSEALGRILWIEYAGATLRYQLYIHVDTLSVGVSGDSSHPFGADSMYEIYIPCTSILEGPDGYYPHQQTLRFYYGDHTLPESLQLSILKRPDGDLKVWPSMPFPLDHPNRKSHE
jgi:hypothetical protein